MSSEQETLKGMESLGQMYNDLQWDKSFQDSNEQINKRFVVEYILDNHSYNRTIRLVDYKDHVSFEYVLTLNNGDILISCPKTYDSDLSSYDDNMVFKSYTVDEDTFHDLLLTLENPMYYNPSIELYLLSQIKDAYENVMYNRYKTHGIMFDTPEMSKRWFLWKEVADLDNAFNSKYLHQRNLALQTLDNDIYYIYRFKFTNTKLSHVGLIGA